MDLSIAVCATAISVLPGRPIWIDEFVHFAFGAFGSTSEAWAAITTSINGVNHGQTGVYMLIDYWLFSWSERTLGPFVSLRF